MPRHVAIPEGRWNGPNVVEAAKTAPAQRGVQNARASPWNLNLISHKTNTQPHALGPLDREEVLPIRLEKEADHDYRHPRWRVCPRRFGTTSSIWRGVIIKSKKPVRIPGNPQKN